VAARGMAAACAGAVARHKLLKNAIAAQLNPAAGAPACSAPALRVGYELGTTQPATCGHLNALKSLPRPLIAGVGQGGGHIRRGESRAGVRRGRGAARGRGGARRGRRGRRRAGARRRCGAAGGRAGTGRGHGGRVRALPVRRPGAGCRRRGRDACAGPAARRAATRAAAARALCACALRALDAAAAGRGKCAQ
jgi:hypothetical protein